MGERGFGTTLRKGERTLKSALTSKQLAFCRHFVRTRNGREAAAAAGFSLFPERTAQRLLADKRVRAQIEALEKDVAATRAELVAGYRRLAFGSVSDAVRLLMQEPDGEPLDLDRLDLFLVSDIKRPKGGGMEIKFFDRQKALERLEELQAGNSDSALPFYRALERSAALFSPEGGED